MAALLGQMHLTEGSSIQEYEKRFAKTVGAQYAFSFAAGRMGLYVLLEALGIGPGDEVIIPAFTCVVVANAILYRGARPIYVDIDQRTFNIDVEKLEGKITSSTKAIIAQHTFGLICDIEGLWRVAKKWNLAILEDCAHALGSKLGDRPAGSLGTAAYFSTDHSKIINTCTGGVVTTNDQALAKKISSIYEGLPFLSTCQIRMTLIAFLMEILFCHPRVYRFGRYIYRWLWRLGVQRAFFFDELEVTKPTCYPYPARLSNAQAHIGLIQLHSLPENLQWRRRLARLYESETAVYKDLIEKDYSNHSFLRYVLMAKDRKTWEDFFSELLDRDIWFTSVAHGRQKDFHEICYSMGSCPIAEETALHCVNLPTHPRLVSPGRLVRRLRKAQNQGLVNLNFIPICR